jgi:hypothetical protein
VKIDTAPSRLGAADHLPLSLAPMSRFAAMTLRTRLTDPSRPRGSAAVRPLVL